MQQYATMANGIATTTTALMFGNIANNKNPNNIISLNGIRKSNGNTTTATTTTTATL